MKKLLVTVLMVMTMAVMTACGGSEAVAFSISNATASLLGTEAFSDTLTKCDGDKAIALYGVDSSVLAEYEVYIGTGSTAEEIAIFRVKDAKDVATVKAACEARVEAQKKACENYLPDEMPKLESPVLVTAGNYVVLVVSGDNTAVNSALDAYIK